MKTTIKLSKIELFGYHGVNKSEKVNGQLFEIDVEITNRINNKIKDDIKYTINYCDLYNDIVEQFSIKKYSIIEALAYDLVKHIANKYNAIYCIVKIRKPNVPINGKLDFVEVGIENYE